MIAARFAAADQYCNAAAGDSAAGRVAVVFVFGFVVVMVVFVFVFVVVVVGAGVGVCVCVCVDVGVCVCVCVHRRYHRRRRYRRSSSLSFFCFPKVGPALNSITLMSHTAEHDSCEQPRQLRAAQTG